MMELWYLMGLFVTFAAARTRHVPGSKYYINFLGVFTPCEDVDNAVIDMNQLLAEKRNLTVVALIGDIIVHKAVDNLALKISIYKDVNANWEFFTLVEEKELCKHITEEDKTWTPFIKEMGISECPIPEKTYNLKDSTIDLSTVQVDATHAGRYRAKIELFEEEQLMHCVYSEALVEP